MLLCKLSNKVNDRDKDGWTALMYAGRYNQNLEVIETLLKHGANVKIKDNGSTSKMGAKAVLKIIKVL